MIALGLALLSLAGGHHHQHHYWWMATTNCTIFTSTRRDGTWRGIPYITCAGAPSHWSSMPQTINPADNVNAPPDTTFGAQPCDYEDVPCQ